VRVELRAPTAAAVEWVADNMRPADVQELEATHGMPMDDRIVRRKLMRAAVAASAGGECLAAHCPLTGRAVALLGVAPDGWMAGTASPWLIGTQNVAKFSRDLVVLGRGAVKAWSEHWPLVNWVDARNTAAVRWLQRIGFELDQPAPRGPAGVMFRRFSLRAPEGREEARGQDDGGDHTGHGPETVAIAADQGQ
jgi:hypothetical protein